ncbi:MAG TPA: 4-hydroxybenzoate octaprenyltransferase [Gammaproteobacteria bacterium]|nr:4-hydroxybenzoate octaprenyltransferase [Gammaproteobacteria bacterium]
MRLHQPRGILLLLFPSLWALTIATQGHLGYWGCIFFLGAMVTRSLGCILNDMADSDIDRLVWRTSSRPLANHSISVFEALILATICLLFAFILMIHLPLTAWYWSFLALIGMALYPLAKRYFSLPQLSLSIVFSLGIPIAFTINNQSFSLTCLTLTVINALWIFAYDSMYALADLPDDDKLPIYTSAKTLQNKIIPCITACLVLCLIIFIGFGYMQGWSHYFFLSLFIVALLFALQIKLIWNLDPNKSLEAFLINPWVGLIIFLGILYSYP